MDDEQILARGGDEHDIAAFAEQNGADLTENDFCVGDMYCKEMPLPFENYCQTHINQLD